MYHGEFNKLKIFFNDVKPKIIEEAKPINKNLLSSGGGIIDI